MRSSTLGTICQPIPSHHLLGSGRSCRECSFLWPLWPQKEWFADLLSLLVNGPLELPCVELAGPATGTEVPSQPRGPLASCVEIVRKAGFSRAVALAAAADLWQTPCTSRSGPGSSVGMINGVLIPSRRLSLRELSFFFTFARNPLCLSLR